MTASITALSNLLSNSATSFAGRDDDMTIGIKSNIARDALKRASDFRTVEDCIFEAMANAYEAYDMGQTPRVWLEIKGKGRDTTVIIRDKGVGMCSAKGLVRFFSLHLKTERRENGLNMRGYNGTGKIAAFKYADRMQVETVKDGLRNIVVLTSDILEQAARDEVQPRAQFLVKDQPTTDPNGTTITITKIKKGFPFNADTMRAIRTKVAFEQMMWMKNAEIFINDELVPAQSVKFTEKWGIASPCGNFSGTIYYNESKYDHELPAVYMSASRVFLAREQFGMEGRRFRQNIHVDVTASEEWATEHFYDRREAFVSESRDLKLKLNNNPQAQAYADFVTAEVEKVMDMLDERENEKRRQAMNETQAELERELSKLFSHLVTSEGGPVVNIIKPDTPKPTPEEKVVHRNQNRERQGDGKQKSPLINFEFTDLADEREFEVDYVAKRIKLNRQGAVLKALALHNDQPIYQVATFEIATAAFCDLLANNRVNEVFADKTPSVMEVTEMYSSISSEVRARAATLTPTYYTNCANGAAATAA